MQLQVKTIIRRGKKKHSLVFVDHMNNERVLAIFKDTESVYLYLEIFESLKGLKKGRK